MTPRAGARRCSGSPPGRSSRGSSSSTSRSRQPTLEDIYLELTGDDPRRPRQRREAERASSCPDSNDPVGSTAAAADLGLVALAGPLRAARVLAQPRPRALHVRVPADVPGDLREPRHGQHISSRRRDPLRRLLRPRDPRLRRDHDDVREHGDQTAILRDEGVLKRMQGTPLPRWAYVAARIGSTT